VVTGNMNILDDDVHYASGTTIAKFPGGGMTLDAVLTDQVRELLYQDPATTKEAVLGLYQTMDDEGATTSSGRIVVYGDSSCIDDASFLPFCPHLIDAIVAYAVHSSIAPALLPALHFHADPYSHGDLPQRVSTSTLYLYSNVIDARGRSVALPPCISTAPMAHSTNGSCLIASRPRLNRFRFIRKSDTPNSMSINSTQEVDISSNSLENREFQAASVYFSLAYFFLVVCVMIILLLLVYYSISSTGFVASVSPSRR
jgi:hypothetical protein